MVQAAKQRQERLLALLDQQGQIDVAGLVGKLHASQATLRRDLAALEEQGLLMRTFAGARSIRSSSLVARTFTEKRRQMRKEKQAIASAAAALVEPGMVVALDSGTTTWRIAAALRGKAPLTIVTTALAAVEELGPVPGMKVELSGGTFRPANLDFVGPAAIERLANMRADIAFVGVDSLVAARGGFSADATSAAVAAALARCAQRTVVVMDHTKFDAQGCHLVVAASDMDYLITDAGLSPQMHKRLAGEPYQLIVGPKTQPFL